MTAINLLANHFGVGPDFVDEILARKDVPAIAKESNTVEAFQASVGDAWKYVSYALGTNQRAENSLSRMLSLDVPKTPKRALDVGCGYGGFLYAFGRRGYRSVGVEIDSDLAKLAQLNLKGADFDYEVHVGNLFGDELTLGSFDLITVNDVIEHLPDPIGAFNKLASLLTDGGVLAIYAPNGKSIFCATADPHNRVLGSSSMPGPLAKVYVQETLRSRGYGLGEYFDLDTFKDLCRRNRLEFRYRPHDGGERPENAKDYLKQFVERFASVDLGKIIAPILAREVESHLWNYLKEYSEAAAGAIKGIGYCDFNDKYLARAWTITCKKV